MIQRCHDVVMSLRIVKKHCALFKFHSFYLTPSGAMGSKERTVQKRFRINFHMPSGKLDQLVKTPVFIVKSAISGQFSIDSYVSSVENNANIR